jgi:hexulose-6-phosphate isomerase
MKIGINRWYFASDTPLIDCLNITRDAGLDSLEVNIAETGDITPDTPAETLAEMAALAKQVGVAMPSLSTGLGWKYPLTSESEETRRKGQEMIRGQLRVAKALGMDAILVVPGIVNGDTSYDDAYSRALKALQELAPDAEALGVHIGVENVWNKFLLSPLEFARFVDEVGSPFVGAYFDVGNVLVYGFPEQWIRILGKRIVRIHVKDFKTSVGNITGFCHPLLGDVAWTKVAAALREIGYDGYITAEVDTPNVESALALKNLGASLRAVFGA